MSDKPYLSHHRAVCGEGDLAAFMFGLLRFLADAKKPSRFADKAGVERTWIARTWEQWAEDRCLSLKQVRRILEKAEDLSYIERARRMWGDHGVVRLHLTITDAYIAELKRCVDLSPKEYLKAKTAARRQVAAPTQGHDHVAQSGTTILPTEGKTILPIEGNSIGDSSLTHSESHSKTAIPAGAEDAQPGSVQQKEHPSSGEEKSMTLSPHSPPSPEPAMDATWHAATNRHIPPSQKYQFNCLIEQLAPGTALEVVKYALKHWGDIVDEVDANHDGFDSPPVPSFIYLLEFAHVAVECKARHDKKATQLVADLADATPSEAKSQSYIDKMTAEVAADDASIAVGTSQGWATRVRDLGLLVEWHRARAEFKHPNTEVTTDEQIAALGWWARYMPEEWGQRLEDRVASLVAGWDEYVARFGDADELGVLDLQQPLEQPSLEFVWHVVEGLKAAKVGTSATLTN